MSQINDFFLILTYFDNLEGPIPILSSPRKIDPKIEKVIQNMMDLDLPESFFELEANFGEKTKFLNYYFELDSDWARGRKEMLLLTAVLPKSLNSLFIEFILKQMVKKLDQMPAIYRAFYLRSKKDESTKNQFQILQNIFNKTYNDIKFRLDQLSVLNGIKTPSELQDWNKTKVNKTILKTFVSSIDARIPTGANLLYDIGSVLGDKFKDLFQANTIDELLDQFNHFWRNNELGEIDEVCIESNENTICFNVYECFECSHMPVIGEPVCKFDEGLLTKIIQSKLEQPVEVVEVECFATGKHYCRFHVSVLDKQKITKIALK